MGPVLSSSVARFQGGLAEPSVRGSSERSVGNEAHPSGVSWTAVVGGAFVAAALSLILLALGTGLGLSSVSPWSNVGASASTISTTAILWLIAMQIMSASMGGYLAGRLRTRWPTIHTDEVYFRDRAHGFLSWAVALVVTAAFLTSAATYMVGPATSSAAGGSGARQADGRALDSNAYFVDALFRSDRVQPDPNGAAVRDEAGRILAHSVLQGTISAGDQSYLAQLVDARTGLSRAEAEKRVADVLAADQATVDAARKMMAHGLLWVFLALLMGAFCASVAATIGGKQRDHVVIV